MRYVAEKTTIPVAKVYHYGTAAEKLGALYRQMANIVLQLSKLASDHIGSLVQDDDGGFSVSGRPLTTMNMNSILEFTEAPQSLLPNRQYSTAIEWYSALADMHLTQLAFQHNDAVEDEDDARDKYIARQLFRRLEEGICLGWRHMSLA